MCIISTKQKKIYFVKDIQKDQIIIGREKGEDSKFKRTYFFERIRQINDSNGILDRREFKGSVAKMAAVVYLHPFLAWINNNDYISGQDAILGISDHSNLTDSLLKNDDPEELQRIARKVRRGQRAFRLALLKEYDNKCCITGCSVKDVLQAAHISAHSKTGNNQIYNGLLIRSDIHDLFDVNKIMIEPFTHLIHIHPTIQSSEYGKYHLQVIRNKDGKAVLSNEYLELRWKDKKW